MEAQVSDRAERDYLVGGLSDRGTEVGAGVLGPLGVCSFKGRHRDLRRKPRRWWRRATLRECVCEGVGERCRLGVGALLESWGDRDDFGSLRGDRAVGDQERDRGGESLDEDSKRRELDGRGGDGVEKDHAQFGFAVKEHLAFVGKVAEVGALGHSGARSDLGGGGLVIAALAVELQRCFAQSTARFGPVSGHLSILRSVSDCRNVIASGTVTTSRRMPMCPVSSTVVCMHEYGEPLDVLRQESIEVADPPPAQVRLRVAAVGLNPADWELCRGFMARDLPRGIGYDVAGTVDAVGAGVEDVAVGDLVFGTTDFLGQPSAGVADFAILDSYYHVPDGLETIEAAVLPMAVQTATWTLDALGVKPGDTLLVHGAGATVGFAATQIALRRGARVIATAGLSFTSELNEFGAQVTPYGAGMAERVRALAGGPIDFVFDAPPPNPGSIAELITLTETPDRVMTISNHDEARRLGARVNLDHLAEAAPAKSFIPEYASMTARGEFRIPIAQTYPLAEWRNAVKLSTSGHPHGKVVLLP